MREHFYVVEPVNDADGYKKGIPATRCADADDLMAATPLPLSRAFAGNDFAVSHRRHSAADRRTGQPPRGSQPESFFD